MKEISHPQFYRNKQYRWSILFLAFGMMILLDFQVVKFNFSDDSLISDAIYRILSRLIGIGLSIYFVRYFQIEKLYTQIKCSIKKKLVIFCLGIIIAINNFPFLSLMDGSASIDNHKMYLLVWIIGECLTVAIFEELLFREIILKCLLAYQSSGKQVIFSLLISSALFSLSHALNGGLSIPFLQLGYTFLMGLMLSYVVYRTGQLSFSIIIHFLYNVGGYLIGQIVLRDNVSILLIVETLIVSVVIGTYYLIDLIILIKNNYSNNLKKNNPNVS